MIDISIDASDFKKKREDLEKKVDGLSQENNILLGELFTPHFMMKYSQFSSFDEMVEKSGFKVDTQKDFEAIDDIEWDNYVQKTTKISNWQEMLNIYSTIFNNIPS